MNQERTWSHDELAELLPWFVNGTLNEAHQSAVSAHLDDCETCRDDVNSLIGIAARFKTGADTDLGDRPQEAALSFAESLPERRPTMSSARLKAIAGITCSVLVLGVVITLALLPRSNDFRTLSHTGVPADAAVIQIVFSDQATAREIRTTLLEDGRDVLSGPSRQGVYRVAIDAGVKPGIHLARLRDNEAVIFAELEEP